jgi:hypothetical protein
VLQLTVDKRNHITGRNLPRILRDSNHRYRCGRSCDAVRRVVVQGLCTSRSTSRSSGELVHRRPQPFILHICSPLPPHFLATLIHARSAAGMRAQIRTTHPPKLGHPPNDADSEQRLLRRIEVYHSPHAGSPFDRSKTHDRRVYGFCVCGWIKIVRCGTEGPRIDQSKRYV